MTDPVPPSLPAGVPRDLRDFVECRSASATLRDGPQAWVELPPQATTFLSKDTKPELTITPGASPGSASIVVRIGFISARLGASVSSGELSIDTSGLPGWAPASIAAGLAGYVAQLNAWFAANGMALAPLELGPGEVTLRKIARGPGAGSGGRPG